MNVDGEKIRQLVKVYGQLRDYPEKSYLAKFCDDFDLNYNQWNNYTRNGQAIGIKIIHQLVDIFPELNLNWFMKNEGPMFLDENMAVVEEPGEKYLKEITPADVMKKLDQIHFDVKLIRTNQHKTDTEN